MRYLIIFQLVQFIPCQEYYLFRDCFQFGLECVVCNVLMMPFFEAPTQEPFEKPHLFANSAVSHVLFITQEINILVQPELVEVFKGYILLELFDVISYRCKFLIGGCRPIILVATLFYKLIEHFPKTNLRFFLLFSIAVFHPQIERIL